MYAPQKDRSAQRLTPDDFQRLFENAPGLFLVLDPGLKIAAVTEGYLRATMTKREDILGRGIFDVFPDNPQDAGATGETNLRASLERVLTQKRTDAMAVQKYDIAKPAEEGGGFEERFWSPVNSPVVGTDGELAFIIHRVEDVTSLVKANLITEQQAQRTRQLEHEVLTGAGEFDAVSKMLQKARIERQRYESLLNSIGGVVWEAEAGQAGGVTNTYVSPLAMERTGYAREEWTPGFWHRHAHKDDVAIIDRRSEAAAGGGELNLEYRIRAADGHELWMRERVAVVQEDGRSISRGLVLDISSIKRSEEEFRQAQKMESIGLLAGGVAHDFNNMLGVIMGQASFTLMKLPENDPLAKRMDSIIEAGHRAAELTGQLLAFSRQQVLEPKVFSANSVVSETEKMLRNIIGEDIQVVADLAADLGMVRADPGQLQQVIMNLAVNSRDAMPKGGRLLLATSNVHVDEPYVSKHSTVSVGDYVLLVISDTGAGMDAATQARIFEPFFTTKERGRGTGLGLATAYGIIKQSGGHIWVYSELGEGTMFKIYLPRVFQGATTARAPRPRVDCRGTETVLLAEDQQQYRELISEILRDHGYRVLEAGNGKAALEPGRNRELPVHLLLTDVIMPEMSGFDLARSLRQFHPQARVIFMSGYTDDAVSRHGVIEEGDGFLQKPFGPTELVTRVREVLDRA
jgi:PAS domain S-box-containing protein